MFWSEVALTRLKARAEGLFSHGVFAVSERDLQRIRELQKAYYQEVRAIVAQSAPVERVALLNLQLLELGRRATSQPTGRRAELAARTGQSCHWLQLRRRAILVEETRCSCNESLDLL